MSDGINVKMDHEFNNDTAISNTERTVRSNSNDYNQGTMQKQLIHEQYNSAYNHRHIIDRIKAGRCRDISDEPKVENTAAIIIGSGPSLDDSIETLKNWRGGIFCTTSHALTLMYHGIEPTHIVNLDPFCNWEEIQGIDWSRTRTKMIMHPGVWPDLVERWPNEMLLFRQNVGRADSFYATNQRFMYTERTGYRDDAVFRYLVRTEVTQFACSPPTQMFVAERLGYGPMFLCGVDMGYHSGKERFTGYTVTKPERRSMIANAGEIVIPAQWERHEHPIGDTGKLSVGPETIVTNNGLITHPVHLYYKKNLMAAWRLSLINVWSTDSGIITEMPHADIHKVVAYQGSPKKFRPLKPAKCKEISEVYLASVGAFVVECEHGLNFVESTDVENEIPEFIRRLNRGYVCGKCGTMFESNDDLPHDGAECPACKANELKHRNYADVDKNMARIRSRLKAAGVQ